MRRTASWFCLGFFLLAALVASCAGHGNNVVQTPSGVTPQKRSIYMEAAKSVYRISEFLRVHGGPNPNTASPTPWPLPSGINTVDACPTPGSGNPGPCVIPGKVDTGYLTWYEQGSPDTDYVTTSFTPMPLVSAGVSPNPIQDGNSQNAVFLAAPNVSPGAFMVGIGGSPSDGDQVLVTYLAGYATCGETLGNCPQLDIMWNGSAVTWPVQPTVVVGQQVQISVAYRTGTGWDSPYQTLTNIQWIVQGPTVAGYNLSSPGPSPIPSAPIDPTANPVTYFYFDHGGLYTVQVQGELVGQDGKEVAWPIAATQFKVIAPQVNQMTSVTNAVQVGPYPYASPPSPAGLSWGYLAQNQTGIDWTFAVTAAQGEDGQIGTVQLIKIAESATFVPSPSSTATPPSTVNYELDNTLFYIDHVVSVTPGPKATLDDNDSPGTNLPSFVSTLTRADNAKDYLMYKSNAANSIWVTLGVLKWNWDGTAQQNPDGSFSLTTSPGNHASNPTGDKNDHQLPVWKKVFTNTTPTPGPLFWQPGWVVYGEGH